MQLKECCDGWLLILKVWRKRQKERKKKNSGWLSVHRPQQVALCLSPWHHVSISQPRQADHLTFLAHCVATEHVLFSVMLDKLLLSHCGHNGHRACSTGRPSTDSVIHGQYTSIRGNCEYMYFLFLFLLLNGRVKLTQCSLTNLFCRRRFSPS